jgi:hypothetical protein
VRSGPVRGPPRFDEVCGCATVSDQSEHVALSEKEQAHVGLTELHSTSQNGVENGTYARRRAIDHAQDLARRSLAIESLRQLMILLLQLFEQAHILDRDDGLVGKGLEKRDFIVGEWPRLRTPDSDHTE